MLTFYVLFFPEGGRKLKQSLEGGGRKVLKFGNLGQRGTIAKRLLIFMDFLYKLHQDRCSKSL
jgi:hypothetical protein